MNEPTFSVFTACGAYQSYDEEIGNSLDEIIGWLVEDGYVPVAWSAENAGDMVTPDRGIADLCNEAFAAGRIIELIDGKYVPIYPLTLEDHPAEAPTEAPRSPLDWRTKPADRWDGFTVTSGSEDDTLPMPLTHPLQRVGRVTHMLGAG